ncbi:hypothetical protein [Bradyrhizobium guangdongense]
MSKAISLPPESADLINAERSLQEAARFVDEAEAKLRRVSAPNYIDEEDVKRSAMIQRGELPSGPRKATGTKITEAANERDDAKEVYNVRKGIRDAIRAKEEQRVREAMLPVVEIEELKIAESLVQIFHSRRIIEQVEGKLAGRGFGYFGMPCRLDTGRIFPETAHHACDLAQVLRQAAFLGYIKLPQELR